MVPPIHHRFALAAALCAAPLPALAQTPTDSFAAAARSIIAAGHHPWARWPEFPALAADLRAAYEPGGYAPLWIANGGPTPAARAAVAQLAEAGDHGLDPADYDAADVAARFAALGSGPPASGAELALLDTELTLGLTRYLVHHRMGRLDPRRLGFDFDQSVKRFDVAAVVRRASAGENLASLVRALEPRFTQYRLLEAALPRYRALAADSTLAPIDARPPIHPGDRLRAAPALRRLLTALGDLPAADGGDTTPLYDEPLVHAVRRFQARHALETDGVVGQLTLAQLNVPLAERVRQFDLALERLRWLPDLSPPLVVVNVPGFDLFAFDSVGASGWPALAMKVVVGKALDTRTPIFIETMRYIEFRPYWVVPLSIVQRTILPEVRKDPAYLGRNGFEVLAGRRVLGSEATPAVLARLERGTLELRQRPGPDNPLGLAKFIFPNNHQVYLHGTPKPELFRRSRRDLSAGCIRVEDPATLAAWVLRDQPEWTLARIDEAMEADSTSRAFLRTPVTVVIFYTTVVVRPGGVVFFYHDIYKHDAEMERALERGEPFRS
ncbi:MAG: L,D-transpeptidase family protein [Deltaproteobacteria bacterium]